MREKVRDKYAPSARRPRSQGPRRPPARPRRRPRGSASGRSAGWRRRRPAGPSQAPPPPPKPVAPPAPQPLLFPDPGKKGDYRYPPFNLLEPGLPAEKISQAELVDKKRRIEEKLKEFGIEGEVREYHPGPVITTYEYFPAPGIKVTQVANLTEDLALALETESVRIQRIPGKSSLGVEIPNNKREIIKLRDIIESPKFQDSPSKLTFALGKDVHGGVDRDRSRRHAPPAHRRLDRHGQERRPQRPDRQHPLQGHAGGGQDRPHRPQAARVHALRGHPPSPLPGHQRPEEGPRRPRWTSSRRWRSATRSCRASRSATSTSTTPR